MISFDGDETDKGTCPEKGVPEAVGTGQAVQEVGGCDYPSLLPAVSLVPVPDTEKRRKRTVLELMEALKDTYEYFSTEIFIVRLIGDMVKLLLIRIHIGRKGTCQHYGIWWNVL